MLSEHHKTKSTNRWVALTHTVFASFRSMHLDCWIRGHFAFLTKYAHKTRLPPAGLPASKKCSSIRASVSRTRWFHRRRAEQTAHHSHPSRLFIANNEFPHWHRCLGNESQQTPDNGCSMHSPDVSRSEWPCRVPSERRCSSCCSAARK